MLLTEICARSDGGWTVLHNACTHGTSAFVQCILDAGADVNSELLNGRTPLHIAAESGNLQAAECLLQQPHTKRTVKDRFGTTPLLMAAQHGKRDIAEMLAPWNRTSELSQDEIEASKQFFATIVDFGSFKNGNRVQRKSVYDLLYARDPRDSTKHAISTLPQNSKATNYRWIHLPANNIQWAEALLTKRFLEEGAIDIEGFKALETSFSHQHRGQLHHSRFMRPMVQVAQRSPAEPEETKPGQLQHPAVIVEEPVALKSSYPSIAPPEVVTSRKNQRRRQNDAPTVAGAELDSGPNQNGQNGNETKASRQETASTTATSESSTTPQAKIGKGQLKRHDTASTALSESSNASKAGKKSNAATSKSRKPSREEAFRMHSRNNVSVASASAAQRTAQNSCNIFMFMSADSNFLQIGFLLTISQAIPTF